MTRVERRGFIVGTLSLLAAPLAAEAQAAKVARVGYLAISASAPTDPTDAGLLRRAARARLRRGPEPCRSSSAHREGGPTAYPALAAELVRLNVDVIVAHSAPAAWRAKQRRRTIPIVLVGRRGSRGVGLSTASRARAAMSRACEPCRRLHGETLGTAEGGGARARLGWPSSANLTQSGPRPPVTEPRPRRGPVDQAAARSSVGGRQRSRQPVPSDDAAGRSGGSS